MYRRKDAIVDFDSERCIGCKACMQACPYDAIYMDPDDGTAAKCHFCAHRTEVGLEPSCLLTLRDEALSMGLGEAAKTVAKQALLFEEFIAREAKAGRFTLALKPVDKPILLHGHCHQKALLGTGGSVAALRLVPGLEVVPVDSGCPTLQLSR